MYKRQGSRQANPDCEVQELSRCKLRTVYSEAPFEDKREPDADCEQSERCLNDLSQIWKQDKLISAICVQSVDVHVSCGSHGITELAPFFIDPRAK